MPEPSGVKIMTVVGARPNFMKAAPIIAALQDYADRSSCTRTDIRHFLVHTGQHYDSLMSGSFFADLGLPVPDVNLDAGSGSHAIQTAEIMRKFEEILLCEKPDILVVVGDVNSTLACALVAAKISFDEHGSRPLLAHVEAGLRSFDRTMPEEVNRILTDQLADLLFVTEESGLHNLACEGVPAAKAHFVGNTMIDSLLRCGERAESSPILDRLGLRAELGDNGSAASVSSYALLTLHRPANVDHRAAFLNILEGMEELASERSIIFPAHPRTQSRIREFGLGRYFEANGNHREADASRAPGDSGAIRLIEPLGYVDFLCLMSHAALVITDSGGIQEETTGLGVPCVTVRENTERPVTVESGTNIIAGTTRERIAAAIRLQAARKTARNMPAKWDGQAAKRIVEIMLQAYNERTSSPSALVPQPCAAPSLA
ncbi:MAG: non-hydrolyzing UDP-N-acetylglucosamine 2-epimerase [Terriglobia bacterium]